MSAKKRSSAWNGLEGKKKKKISTVVDGCCLNALYSSGKINEVLAENWKKSSPLIIEDGSVELLRDPFQCCILKNFISASESPSVSASPGSSRLTSNFLNSLVAELLKLKFYEKNNDLYQFHQSDDLKKFKSPCISHLKSIFSNEVLPWLRHITGVALTDTIDMTCSKYDYADVLLCHDDELEGRRIAFILYLVPEWLPEDGGSLDLFDTAECGQPREIVRSFLPTRNSFVFFEVNEKSFHQVAEVLCVDKTRLSVNGWFHGPPAPRAELPIAKPLPLAPPNNLSLKELSDWISPVYLDVGTQSQIQQQFEADSQIQLPDFLLEEKYLLLCEELRHCSQKKKWSRIGPPNRKKMMVLENDDLLPISREFVRLASSSPFCLLLAHMTELDLIDNTIKHKPMENGSHKGNSCGTVELDNHADSADILKASSEDSSESGDVGEVELTSSSLCRAEMYLWQHGSYVLAGDPTDPGLGRFCLELVLNFNCEDWCEEYGGTVNYIADDADEEFLTLVPSPNSLSLVYRDKDVLRFTKFINHRSVSDFPLGFQSLSVTYLENAEKENSDNDSVSI